MALGLLLATTAQATLALAPSADVTGAVLADSAESCQRPARGFVPVKAALPALGRTVGVIQVPRTRENAVGAGPVTTRGKWLMAMDPQTRPASGHGSVILSGHAWPDGSALGNVLARDLQVGDRVRMIGRRGQQACYQVTERTSYPADGVPRRKTFRFRGPEQLVIVTCSGRRISPGHWTRRTVWYAVPVVPAPSPPASSPEPAPSGGSSSTQSGSGGLFGGLLGGLLGGG